MAEEVSQNWDLVQNPCNDDNCVETIGDIQENHATVAGNYVQRGDDYVDTFTENHEYDVDDTDVVAEDSLREIQKSNCQAVVEVICLEDKLLNQNDDNDDVVEDNLGSRSSDNDNVVVEYTSGSRNDETNDVVEHYLGLRIGDNDDAVEDNLRSRISDDYGEIEDNIGSVNGKNDDVAEDNNGSQNGDNDGAAEYIHENRNADNEDVVEYNLGNINREHDDVVEDNLGSMNSEHCDVVEDNLETRTGDNEAVVELVSQTNSQSEIRTENTEENLGEKDAWHPDEIQSLLIKAINFRASIKDIKTIILCGGEVNRPMNNGLHPLHYAAYTDNIECVELLLNYGANVNATDDIGYTPIHLTARRGNYRSMEKLIENGALINYSEPGVEIHQTDEKNRLGYTTIEPLNLSIQNGHPDCVKLLLGNGARSDNKYFMGYEICLTPLDDPACLELLLKHGATPNVFNRCGLSPLMKACKDHHIEAVRILIKYGADVNALCPPLFEQKSVLQYAILSGNIVIINILLGKGAKMARQGEYKFCALHTAIQKGRADICRLLLQYRADVNERTDEGATPLMISCCVPDMKDRREIVTMLIDCGADINAHSPCYSYFDPYLSPLTEYFKNIGNSEGFNIVKLLIRNGAVIHFTSSGLERELKRLRDPFSIMPYAHCMRYSPQIFELVITAASKYSPLLIHATENISEDMKDSLLYMATRPRELKHLVRVSMHGHMSPGFPNKVNVLPIPAIIKSYLLYK